MVSNILRGFVVFFNYFILFYVLTVNSIYFIQLVLSAFSLSDYLKKMLYSDYKKYTISDNMIPISVLVPAYNEEATIVENIQSLLSLNYPLFEIVVVNDGSKDNSLNKIIEAYDLRLVNQPIRYHIKTKKVKGIYRNANIPNLVLVDK